MTPKQLKELNSQIEALCKRPQGITIKAFSNVGGFEIDQITTKEVSSAKAFLANMEGVTNNFVINYIPTVEEMKSELNANDFKVSIGNHGLFFINPINKGNMFMKSFSTIEDAYSTYSPYFK